VSGHPIDVRARSVGAAAFVGLLGALAWWLPPEPPEPWGAIGAWAVLVAVAALSGAAAYVLGGRGKIVAVAVAVGVASTFSALPVLLGAWFVIVLLVELVVDALH
jgi:hypothetical protein